MIAKGAPVDQLDLQVRALGEPIAVSTLEVVQDVLTPAVNRAR